MKYSTQKSECKYKFHLQSTKSVLDELFLINLLLTLVQTSFFFLSKNAYHRCVELVSFIIYIFKAAFQSCLYVFFLLFLTRVLFVSLSF